MSGKFAKGATVRLNSGGPPMTVEGYAGITSNGASTLVKCKWFVGDAVTSSSFEEAALTAVTLPKDGA